MGKFRKWLRSLADRETGNMTLYHKDEDFKYKLTVENNKTDNVIMRRKRRKQVDVQYFELAYVHLYRAFGGFVADGTFSASPGTEFMMAMLSPCVRALLADSGAKRIVAAEETSHLEVIIESWKKNGVIAPVHFAKYHLKFKPGGGASGNDDEREW